MKKFNSIRAKLFLWYIISLISVTAFFYLAVHFYSLPDANYIFLLLLIVLATVGFFIINKMTGELTGLTSKIKSMTSENLSEKIINIKSDDEIGELARSFNHLLDRLNSSFVRERQFIGDMAHELKTPLSILKNTMEVALSKNRTNQDYKDTLSNTLIDIDNLSSTINDVLDLAWAQSDNLVLKDKVNLSKLMTEIEELLRKMAQNKKIIVSSEITQDITITGSRQKLFRAVFNLIDNAIKYTPHNGKIAMVLAEENKEVTMEITNTGPGINKGDLPLVFSRFYRGNKDSKTIGSGLGLAICKSIIEAHKGSISIASLPHKLTTVRIVLPS